MAIQMAIAAPAPVPPGTVVEAPDWSAGSSWYYSDGYGLKVSSSSNGVTTFERLDAPGQWFSRQGFLRKDLVSATATRNSIYRTVSEQTGARLAAAAPLTFEREYLSNGKLVVHASSWTLEGRETITVPAGTFDCWVIVWRTRSLKSDWTGYERWWYSPAAQNYVRMEYKYGPAEASSRVLMRYNLGQRSEAAAPGKLAALMTPPAPEAPRQQISFDPLPVIDAAPAQAEPLQPAEELSASNSPAPVEAVAIPAPAPEPIVSASAEPPLPPLPPELPAAQPASPVPSARAYKPPARLASPGAAPAEHVWRVQLASSKDQPALRADFEKILAANSARLEGIPNGISSAQIAGRGTFYRAWVGAFPSARDAEKLCGEFKSLGKACAVMRTGNGAAAG
jgi:hypothetical protein